MMYYLEHQLGNLDGVCGRAVAGGEEGRGAGGGICDVILVVGAVEILAVPAAVSC